MCREVEVEVVVVTLKLGSETERFFGKSDSNNNSLPEINQRQPLANRSASGSES
jgi:hypothetical protein